MHITDQESSFQIPASRKRKASSSPSLPPANQPPSRKTATKTGLRSLPQVLTQNLTHKHEL